MTDVPKSYPRLGEMAALEAFSKLQGASASEAASTVNLSLEGIPFYPMAPARVSTDDLTRIRSEVVAIAEAHGFPESRPSKSGSNPGFEQELAARMSQIAPMLPAEAADQEIWHFLTLRVLPDVAVWRYPVDDPGDSEPRSERIIGTRRGIYRQAWWRGHLLGTEACLVLTEDEFVQLADRVGVVGFAPLARAVVAEHLVRVESPTYGRRAGLREAMKAVRRELGRISIDALGEDELRLAVARCFDSASGSPSTQDLPSAASPPRHDRAGAPARFRQAARQYLPVLTELMRDASAEEAAMLAEKSRRYAARFADGSLAGSIAADLSRLVDDWDAFSREERTFITAAFDYFLLEDDAVADDARDGLIDDNDVVDAVYVALDRQRGED